MMMEDKFTVSGRHTIQYTDQVSQKCTPETYMILLTNIAAINLIKKPLVIMELSQNCYY